MGAGGVKSDVVKRSSSKKGVLYYGSGDLNAAGRGWGV